MNKLKSRYFNLLLLVFLTATAIGQPFAGEIETFRKQDSISMPPSNAILFVGSSSFRLWSDLSTDFPGYTIINRGFGGSSFPDVIRFADQTIYRYNPKQVIIYCGENDLAASDTVSAVMVYDRFKILFQGIRTHLPNANILFVSIKPSPSRERIFSKVKFANALIQTFLERQQNAAFVDVFTPMLGPDGKAIKELFTEDNLHMNKMGYAIWQKKLQPLLIK